MIIDFFYSMYDKDKMISSREQYLEQQAREEQEYEETSRQEYEAMIAYNNGFIPLTRILLIRNMRWV